MADRIIPETFPPGEYIRDELEERGWTQADLADIIDRPPAIVSDLIAGKRQISPDIAIALGKAFGTSAQVWLNLQTAYELAGKKDGDDNVSRKAKLYDRAPIREMQRRGWIEKTGDTNELEKQFCRFFGIDNVDDDIRFAYAARKSDNYGKLSSSESAWLTRAKNLARSIVVEGKFGDKAFDAMMKRLTRLRGEPENILRIPPVLSSCGVRFLIIEKLPHTKIDGACFWLDEQSPVVVLSMRYDRIDWFWHSLVHELGHVKRRDGFKNPLLETLIIEGGALMANEKPVRERAADKFAVNLLVDQKMLQNFIEQNHPAYSRKAIVAFSREIGVHPGIIVGQLHFRGFIPYSNLRALLVKVRDVIIRTAPTDGWGKANAA